MSQRLPVLFRMLRGYRFSLFALLIVALPLSTASAQITSPVQPVYQHGAVAADHPAASAAGVEILQAGGTVVDAAVATGFALSVVRPASSGLGGGGFMVLWLAESKTSVALDYRERAPAAAHRDMYRDPLQPTRAIPDKSEHGPFAVAIPGHVAGLCLAHQKYGKLPLATVLAPAIRLAKEGVLADELDVSIITRLQKDFRKRPELQTQFAPFWKLYLYEGRPVQLGDCLTSPQDKVLELIAQRGPEAFYTGEVAESLCAAAGADGNWLTVDDLRVYRPTLREPLRYSDNDGELLTMPPPSSGGIALIAALKLQQALGATHPNWRVTRENRTSATSLHQLAEILKPVFADRAQFLGDADYVQVPVQTLLSDERACERAQGLNPQLAIDWKKYGSVAATKDGGTTHFSVMDSAGNAVACTETINLTYGSWVVDPQFGIILNNEMDDFAAVPGTQNAFGLLQSENNAVAPGKRPLSSMTPTILVRDGKAVVAVGASGGPRIITATWQVYLNLTRHGLSPQESVIAPRIHHQWFPDQLELEGALFEQHQAELEELGHKIQRRQESAVVQVVTRDATGIRPASDPRKFGRPAGY